MWDLYDDKARATLSRDGIYLEPSDYGEPYEITTELLSDGQNHLLLEKGLDVSFPTRILQGSDDHEVPPPHAIATFDALRGADVTLTYIKGGDHRLSTPGNLRLICDTALRLAERADGVE
jgi:pimeloyl-ACP methyl ester carboxylesterase